MPSTCRGPRRRGSSSIRCRTCRCCRRCSGTRASRAALLGLLAEPATTSGLAGRLGVTAGGVSQQLGVLRAAGLVTTRRDGRTVLHLRTDRADALLRP
jgi:DNA-binding transcriptional ArsR family regulator